MRIVSPRPSIGRSVTGKPMRTIPVWCLLLVLSAPALRAQEAQVRRDSATGDYLITIYDDDMEPREIRLTPADQVDTEVRARVERVADGAVAYEYSVRVREGSRLPLRTLQVDCPRDAHVDGFRASVPWEGETRRLNADRDGVSCQVLLGAAPLPAGNPPLSFAFETPLLPGIGESRAIGETQSVRWPTSDPIPENAAAERFIRTIDGLTGGWKTLTEVVPARDRDAFDDPAGGLGLLKSDLSRACGDLGWITSAAVCRSLEEALDAASRAVEQGRTEAARDALGDFLAELDAQHEPEAETPVIDDAYALLRLNGKLLHEALLAPGRDG